MVICFECGPKTKILLDGLLETGHYRDYSEIIALAVQNLRVLQSELASKGSLTFESESELMALHARSETDHVPERNKASSRSNTRNSDKTDLQSEIHSMADSDSIPNLFLLDGIESDPSTPADPPADVWTMKQEVPLERWIFGQYNKFLPAKVSCRALAHLLQHKPEGVWLADAALEISQQALILGRLLARYDKQNGTKRDDALSTAFPSPDREVEKSRMRYANQFVASVTKKGKVSGLLVDLKLINHTEGNKPRLNLTEAGWHFARLENSVLDGDTPGSARKFTADETSFLLNHISSAVPAEDFAYRTILTAVTNGANTPERLDSVLQKHISDTAGRRLTESFLASQRSGAVSRMADLELIVRKRDGVRVFYVVTETGKKYTQNKVIPLQRRTHIE